MPISNRQRALDLLFDQTGGRQLLDFKITLGDRRPVDEDAVWGEIASALEQVRDGRATVSTSFHDNAPKVDIEEYLAKL